MRNVANVRHTARKIAESAGAASEAVGLARVTNILRQRGISIERLSADDPALADGDARLDHQLNLVMVRDDLSDAEVAQLCAHELGHITLHPKDLDCHTNVIAMAIEDEAIQDRGLSEPLIGYGAFERKELQANAFAREFLLPRALTRQAFITDGMDVVQIAERYGVPLNLVTQQLIDHLLAPDEPISPPQPIIELDQAQQAAAEHAEGPLMVIAAPGTGKTQTLVRRVQYLLQQGAVAEEIVVLTYSTKAADELAERLAAAVPDAVHRLWCGTLHAFGLDLIRRYHQLLDLDPDARLLDTADLIELLEDVLPQLSLDHYQNLADPALALNDLVLAVQRVKEELVTPERFRELARAEIDRAGDDPIAIVAATRMLEIAEFFEAYEQLLSRHGALDFPDLVSRAINLLNSEPQVLAQTQERHRHFLIDEYQDVNRASASLLQILSTGNESLWAVGDPRQSIYRFRGASAANMDRFSEDYPAGHKIRLTTNYRSDAPIVAAFSAFANQTTAGSTEPLQLLVNSTETGARPTIISPHSYGDEASCIAQQIQTHQSRGSQWRDHAVLCRTNARATAIAQALTDQGIPVLHLGDVLERPEIKQLIALMAFVARKDGNAVIGLATMTRYALDGESAISLAQWCSREPGTALQTIQSDAADEWREKNQAVWQLITMLREDFSTITPEDTPFALMRHCLFGPPRLIDAYLVHDDIDADIQRAAIQQFIRFVRSAGAQSGQRPIQQFLRKLRLTSLTGAGRDLRELPVGAAALDGVSVMTIHAAKGLQFPVVHLAGMIKGTLPATHQESPCPMPPGVIQYPNYYDTDHATLQAHQEEEEGLCFVAMSRAKSALHLYAPMRKFTAHATPSEFLFRMGELKPLENDDNGMPISPTDEGRPLETGSHWANEPLSMSDLILMQSCPRRYYYKQVLGLASTVVDSPFRRMRQCVQNVIDTLSDNEKGEQISGTRLNNELRKTWALHGPTRHPLSESYLEMASALVQHLASRFEAYSTLPVTDIALEFSNGTVVVKPDFVGIGPDGRIRVSNVRFGRTPAPGTVESLHIMLAVAAEQEYGAGQVAADVVHLSDEKSFPVPITAARTNRRLQQIDRALGLHAARRFPTKPSKYNCPRCPHFFVCPAVPR